jgi:hypothetical protein
MTLGELVSNVLVVVDGLRKPLRIEFMIALIAS